jgi:spore germination protein
MLFYILLSFTLTKFLFHRSRTVPIIDTFFFYGQNRKKYLGSFKTKMSIFSKFIKRQSAGQSGEASKQVNLGDGLAERLDWLQNSFGHCSDVVFHEMTANETKMGIVYVKGMIDQKIFDENVLKPILAPGFATSKQEFFYKLLDLKQVSSIVSTVLTDMNTAVQNVLDGFILIIIEGESRMLAFPLTNFEKRQVSEPANENVIRGPREAFVEDISTNITLIRRRIKTPLLKMEEVRVGKFTQTKVVIGYIEGVCRQELVEEVRKRISNVDIDGVLGSSYLEESIEDNKLSPFPQAEKTERPDVVSAALLEGRVVIFVDGTPIPLIVPVNLYMFLQSAEDYYQRYYSGSWIRWIRMTFMLTSLLFPSIYIAVTTFHPEMIPTNLLISVASARENVPFPAFIEAIIMEITFEGLREAGIRTPKAVGQAISILGALVIGQAAVQAGIVSAPMVIIVSLTGIANFIIPHYDLAFTIRFLRFPIMFLAGSFGIFGVFTGLLFTYIHVVSLRSFGMPYLAPTAPMRFSQLKDIFIRAPWWSMSNRSTQLLQSNTQYSGINDDEED